jgi:hypothetical protein
MVRDARHSRDHRQNYCRGPCGRRKAVKYIDRFHAGLLNAFSL